MSMDRRDLFIAAALAGLLASRKTGEELKSVIEDATAWADAALAETGASGTTREAELERRIEALHANEARRKKKLGRAMAALIYLAKQPSGGAARDAVEEIEKMDTEEP